MKPFDLDDYATIYLDTRAVYCQAANELKQATGPYFAARDAYIVATLTYIKNVMSNCKPSCDCDDESDDQNNCSTTATPCQTTLQPCQTTYQQCQTTQCFDDNNAPCPWTGLGLDKTKLIVPISVKDYVKASLK
jgi:hypothetical protein